MQSHCSHCFKCGVKMSLFLTNGGFPWNSPNEVSLWFHSSSHCNFLSTHLQVPFTNELLNCVFRTEESICIFNNKHFKLFCETDRPLSLFLQSSFSFLTMIKVIFLMDKPQTFSIDPKISLVFTSYGLFFLYNINRILEIGLILLVISWMMQVCSPQYDK